MYSFSIAISTTIFTYQHYTQWGSCIGKDIIILSTNMVSLPIRLWFALFDILWFYFILFYASLVSYWLGFEVLYICFGCCLDCIVMLYLVCDVLSIWNDMFCLSGMICFVYLEWYALSIWNDMFCLSGMICFVYLGWYVLSIWNEMFCLSGMICFVHSD